jgi:hypothetical protein
VLFVCRLILENLLKYGLRMNFFKYIAASLSGRGNLPLVLAFPALLLLSFASLGVELLAWRFVHGEDQVGGDAAVVQDRGEYASSDNVCFSSWQHLWHACCPVASHPSVPLSTFAVHLTGCIS